MHVGLLPLFVGIVLQPVAFASQASANDSGAILSGGKLILQENASIVMEREDLTVSAEDVHVAYVFRNRTKTPVTLRVAFPIKMRIYGHVSDERLNARANGLGFRLTVDGVAQSTERELLRTERREAQVTFHWSQVFPPGKRVRVEHHYTVDEDFGYLADLADDALAKDFQGRYCVDPKVILELGVRDGQYRRVHYVLRTGANWAKPIGTFQLGIKAGPKHVAAFTCFPARKKRDGSLESRRVEFVPEADLDVLFVEDPWRRQPRGASRD